MKQLAKNLITAAALTGAMFSSAAMAEQKIGVVSVEAVFQQMPQAVGIAQTIAAEFKDQVDEVERLKKDIEYQINKRQREAATMSEAQIKELEDKIIELRNDYASKAQPLQQSIQRRQAEERNKLLGLIQQSIQKVAADGNFDLVLGGNSAVFAKPEFDLSQQVLDHVKEIK